MKQKVTELKTETDNSAVFTGDFDIAHFNNGQQNTDSSQVHMEPSPGQTTW